MTVAKVGKTCGKTLFISTSHTVNSVSFSYQEKEYIGHKYLSYIIKLEDSSFSSNSENKTFLTEKFHMKLITANTKILLND